MSDADKTLKLLVDIGIIGKEDAQALVGLLDEAKDGVDDLSNEMGVLSVSAADVDAALKQTSESTQDLGQKTEDAGEHASNSRLKHMALHHAMEELNKVSPGLGTSMMFLSHGFMQAGESAEGAAVGTKEFTAALEASMATILPLLAVMLTIQTVSEYWEIYKENVKDAAAEHAKAMELIESSTRRALKAVLELQEAMNPKKHDLADQDEKVLKQRERDMEETATRQKELNKANEDRELAGATTPKEKEDIRAKYELLDKQLEDWQAKQKAAIEGVAAQAIQGQISGIEQQKAAKIAELAKLYRVMIDSGGQIDDLERQKAQAHTSSMGPNGIPFDTTDPKQIADLDQKIAAAQQAQVEARKAYDAVTAEIEKLKTDAGPLGEKLGEISGNASDDSARAAYSSETNRRVFGIKGVNYLAPGIQDQPPGPGFAQDKQIQNLIPQAASAEYSHFEGGKAFDQTQTQIIIELKSLLEKQHLNSQSILELIVTGVRRHESIEKIVEQVQSQVANMRNIYSNW